MCGISIRIRVDGEEVKGADLRLLAHRGPDACGEWYSPSRRFWLGHTRLSILDLSPAGAQPMVDPQTGNVIIFNGEIYNHLELRKDLGDLGWRGTSDTETLLVGYRIWGKSLFERLNGMFAFAIYDASRDSLILARDREGIKPLYIYRKGNFEWKMGSEWRSLFDGDQRRISSQEVSCYLRYGCFQEKSLPQSVKSLSAGSWMEIRSDGSNQSGYYGKEFDPVDQDLTEKDAVRMIREEVENAVERHLLSDVPVASFLSGGVDSSILTLLAARTTRRRLQTLSISFRGTSLDESSYAHQIAMRAQSHHEEIQLGNEEVCRSIGMAVDQMDLPTVDGLNTFLVCNKASQLGIKVALSGLGGDEIFGGYPIYRQMKWMIWGSYWMKLFPEGMHPLGDRLSEIPDWGIDSLVEWRRRKWTNRMLNTILLPLPRLENAIGRKDHFHQISSSERYHYMKPMLLRDADQMSMANSLELRVPFLDRELIRLTDRISGKVFDRAGYPKRLLIKAFEDLISSEIYKRPKMGFVLPMRDWMQGPLRPMVKEGLDHAIETLQLPRNQVNRYHELVLRKKLPWTLTWSLVTLGHWMKKNRVEPYCS